MNLNLCSLAKPNTFQKLSDSIVKRSQLNQIHIYSNLLSSRSTSSSGNHGKQNEFYFEESKITKSMDKSDPNYRKLYERIPLVTVLGWTGSYDKVLKKYSNIYSDMGYHTIRFSTDHSTTFLKRRKHESITDKFIDLINKSNVNKNPILVHTFSNASNFIIYHHIVKNEKNKYSFFKENQRGLIFDCGPGYSDDMVALFKSISNLVGDSIKFPPLKYLFTSIIVSAFWIYDLSHKKNNYFLNATETILRDERNVPLLVYYSTKDKLLLAKYTAKFIEDKKIVSESSY